MSSDSAPGRHPAPTPRATRRIRLAGWSVHTEAGSSREHNEDAVLAAPPLFAVADGVSSRPSGEVASALALAVLRAHAEGSAARLHEAVVIADQAVRRAAMVDEGLTGMATTLTAALVHRSGVAVVHVGHSYAYRLRGASIDVIGGGESPGAALAAADRLGSGAAAPQLVDCDAARGDVWVLCSNGLSDAIGLDGIADVMSSGVSIYDAAPSLVGRALLTGGDDVSVAAFRLA
jgi:protein phosphatase